MGNSDSEIIPWYKQNIVPVGDTALIGFANHNVFEGDCYDLYINGWDINQNNGRFVLAPNKLYDTVISTRCPCFCRWPKRFIKTCHSYLRMGGGLYIDYSWGSYTSEINSKKILFMIGFVKDGYCCSAHFEGNWVWSTIWDDSLMQDDGVKTFMHDAKEKYGYNNVKDAIFNEVPCVLPLDYIKMFFDNVTVKTLLTCVDSYKIRLNLLVSGIAKELKGIGA